MLDLETIWNILKNKDVQCFLMFFFNGQGVTAVKCCVRNNLFVKCCTLMSADVRGLGPE